MFAGKSPLQYAEGIWKSLTVNAIMTPLEGVIKIDELENFVKPEYMMQCSAIAENWHSEKGIENPYTMLWVKATR